MNAFAYHYGATGVSWYRIWQMVKYLQKRGVEIKRLPNESDRIQIPWTGHSNWPGVNSHLEIAEEHDFVITSYRTPRSDSLRLVEQGQLSRLVVDCDDDLFSIHPTNPNYKAWERQPDSYEELQPGEETSSKIKRRLERLEGVIHKEDGKTYFFVPGEDKRENVLIQMKHAALVTVSTPELARIYGKVNPNIRVVPNGVDFDLWEPKPNTTSQFRIGLFGSNTHYWDWKEAVDGIKRFLMEHPDAVVVTNSVLDIVEGKQGERFENSVTINKVNDYLDQPEIAKQLEVHKPVEVEKYPAWLADKSVDVILAPLADITFNKSKSNIKYLEAAALKIPTICQDAEPYNKDIKHGYNGLLAKKPVDWYKYLCRMYENKSERVAMGNRAWMDVKNRYDMALIAAEYETMLHKLTQGESDEKANNCQPACA